MFELVASQTNIRIKGFCLGPAPAHSFTNAVA